MEGSRRMGTQTDAQNRPSNDGAHDEVAREILRAVRSVNFGSVEITIHDSRVVQIERKEKFRFDKPGRA